VLSRSNPVQNCHARSKKDLRRRVFVDAKVQGAVALRVVMYWFSCQFMIAVLMFGFKVTSGGEHLSDDVSLFCRCAFFSTISFLPLAAYDILRLTHRVAGPMLRLRQAMSDLARGEHVKPLGFRDGDFWPDLATNFNSVLQRMEQSRGGDAEHETATSQHCLANAD
jgi:hypothetical protein